MAGGSVAGGVQRSLVLIVDDDRTIRQLCESTLKAEHRILTAENGEQALRLFFAHRPDLVLLDVTMPVLDGWETCRRIRQMSDTPVIMLTARDADQDVVRGLDSGADDYVIKPFHPGQLRARIRAVLRRHQRTIAATPDVLSFGDGQLVVDRVRRLAIVRGKEVTLSATEYKLLEFLAQHAPEVLSTDRILERVWGPAYVGETDYVKAYVGHLRRKIEDDPRNPVYIRARRGLGYYLSSLGPLRGGPHSEQE